MQSQIIPKRLQVGRPKPRVKSARSFVLDGEAVVLGVDGISDFNALHSRKHDHEYALERSASTGSRSGLLHSDADQPPEDLLDDILTWLSSKFDLPANKDRPAFEFTSRMELARLRARDLASSQSFIGNDGQVAQREVVALYDNNTSTILLPDDWASTSPADQSVLVHEMVHHLQNLGKLKFDCLRAREKTAYLAQAKWLERFGLSLEKEFDVDMFTVVYGVDFFSMHVLM